jgi:hypothetical protein
MTPETPVVIETPPPEAAAAEAALEDTAASLDSIADAIEAESEISRDRADEILREVRECRSTVNLLSQSLSQQTESPSIQQMLITLGTLQTSVERIQAEVETLRTSTPSNQPPLINPEENQDGQRESPASPNSSTEQNPPESNPSATPPPPEPQKKKHYVKV